VIMAGAPAVLPINDEGYFQSVFPALSTLPVQTAALSVLVIGFLWVASHGVHALPVLRHAGQFASTSTRARVMLAVTSVALMASANMRPASHLAGGTAATSCGTNVHFQGGSRHVSTLTLRQAQLRAAICRSWPEAPQS
jgi:hypothetical protein